jgi:hypothetical protein
MDVFGGMEAAAQKYTSLRSKLVNSTKPQSGEGSPLD